MEQYDKPTYTGLQTINKLIESATRRGGVHRPTKEKMEFNAEGYATLMKRGYGFRSLIIDRDANGLLQAYASRRGSYQLLCGYSDVVYAQRIIEDLYSNPYYHSTGLYTDRLYTMYHNFKPESFETFEELKAGAKSIHDRALILHDQIQRGTTIFGCANRFKLVSHKALPALNIHACNFNNSCYRITGKIKNTHDGRWQEGEYIYPFELMNLSKADFTYRVNELTGVEMSVTGNPYLIESKMLDCLNSSLLSAPPETPKYIKVMLWMLRDRLIIKDDKQLEDIKQQLVTEDLLTMRAKFNTIFVELMEKAL